MKKIENLKKYYKHESVQEGNFLKNGSADLFINNEGVVSLFINNSLKCRTKDPSLFDLIIIFFENPFHLLEHINNLQTTLNAYVYRLKDELKEEYVFLEYSELKISYKNIKTKEIRSFEIETLTGKITDKVTL